MMHLSSHLPHAQLHSQCSEGFYKTQLESDINSSQSNSIEERLQMMNLLKRFEEENAEFDPLRDDDEDESDEDDLQHRLAGMNLGTLCNSLSIALVHS